jgi:myo-inositol-1(or 4)-monophosphatase
MKLTNRSILFGQNEKKQLVLNVVGIVKSIADYLRAECYKLNALKITPKGPGDYVSDIDILVENVLVEKLKELIPDSGFLTEENTVEIENSEGYWIIDPIDGTSNLINNSSPFAISVAYCYKNEIALGVVHELTRNETYYAFSDGGAFLNNVKIQVSSEDRIENALIAVGIPHSYLDQFEGLISSLAAVIKNAGGLRITGSAATELAYLACGRYSGRFEFGLKPWDIAAGLLIVKEAGGIISDFKGEEDYFTSGELIATNSYSIHKHLMNIVKTFI